MIISVEIESIQVDDYTYWDFKVDLNEKLQTCMHPVAEEVLWIHLNPTFPHDITPCIKNTQLVQQVGSGLFKEDEQHIDKVAARIHQKVEISNIKLLEVVTHRLGLFKHKPLLIVPLAVEHVHGGKQHAASEEKEGVRWSWYFD